MIRSLALIILLCACTAKSKNVLGEDKMQKVLFDYISADVYTSSYVPDSLGNDTAVNAILQQQVFNKHSVSREDFLETYRYYASHPAEFKTMLDSINARQQRADTSYYKKGVVPINAL